MKEKLINSFYFFVTLQSFSKDLMLYGYEIYNILFYVYVFVLHLWAERN